MTHFTDTKSFQEFFVMCQRGKLERQSWDIPFHFQSAYHPLHYMEVLIWMVKWERPEVSLCHSKFRIKNKIVCINFVNAPRPRSLAGLLDHTQLTYINVVLKLYCKLHLLYLCFTSYNVRS